MYVSVQMIAKSLEYAIEATVKNDKDIAGVMGETH